MMETWVLIAPVLTLTLQVDAVVVYNAVSCGSVNHNEFLKLTSLNFLYFVLSP